MAVSLSSKHQKFVKHLKTNPKVVDWADVESLYLAMGYKMKQGGSSHVRFIHPTMYQFRTPKPHPRKTIIHWQIKEVLAHLASIGV